MSLALLVLGFAAAVNPCRARLALPPRLGTVALGAAVALGVCSVVAMLGGAILDAIDVSAESFRLAAGAVLAVEGARVLVAPRPAAEPALRGLASALVPVAFPVLLQPGVLALALAAGGDGAVAGAVGALTVALILVVAAAAAPASALFVAGARVLGALELAVGAAIALEALGDV